MGNNYRTVVLGKSDEVEIIWLEGKTFKECLEGARLLLNAGIPRSVVDIEQRVGNSEFWFSISKAGVTP